MKTALLCAFAAAVLAAAPARASTINVCQPQDALFNNVQATGRVTGTDQVVTSELRTIDPDQDTSCQAFSDIDFVDGSSVTVMWTNGARFEDFNQSCTVSRGVTCTLSINELTNKDFLGERRKLPGDP